MAIRIDLERAATVLREEADADTRGVAAPAAWIGHVTQISEACERANTRTHVAFLGTALLARATDLRASAFAVKANDPDPGAYSARTLGHGVLVPHSVRLGIDLGVSGREPLNNQPYFRISRADLASLRPLVRGRAQDVIKTLVAALGALAAISKRSAARAALRAFIHVRRAQGRQYSRQPGGRVSLGPSELVSLVRDLVGTNAEGGKRAQAVVAGLLDASMGPSNRIVTSRVNDPDRHFPGDVAVLAVQDSEHTVSDNLMRVFEVRQKPVTTSDIDLFVRKCVGHGVRRASVLAVAVDQRPLDIPDAASFALSAGVLLTVYLGWQAFTDQLLFWAHFPPDIVARVACERIRIRLEEAEVSPEAVRLWDAAIRDRS